MYSLNLTKRQRIVIASVVLSLGLLLIQMVDFFILRYRLVVSLSILSFILSLWALREGMTRFKAVLLLILPTLFTLGVSSFYFLLPIRWLTRIPVAIIFGISFYALLLSQNVFNVASSRSIPLYRAASTVAFIFTLITFFFLNNVILALDQPFYLNGLMVAIAAFPLSIQLLWSIELEKITPVMFVTSVIISLLLGEGGVSLSFWPLIPTIWSLLLSTIMYVLLGIASEMFKERLGKREVWEYLSIGVLVLIFSVLITSWTG